MLNFLLTVAIVLLAPGQAGDPLVSSATAQRRIALPFDPPVGEVLRYRMTGQNKIGDSADPIIIGLTLRFERRSGGGFLLTTTFTSPPGPGTDAMLAMMSEPISFEISANGDVVGIHDEDAWWRRIETLLRAYVQTERAGTRGQGMMDLMVAHIRGMPAETRTYLFARNITPLLDLAGSQAVVGEQVAFELSGGNSGRSVMQPWELQLEHAGPAELTYRAGMALSDETVVAMMGQITAMPGVAGPSPLNGVGPSAREERRYRVSRQSGLTTHYTSRTILDRADGSSRIMESWIIEALD